MSEWPSYFEAIQHKAFERWKQLEADPELAGPWRLLFSQVQSPRHVVSELLQNADDAGATSASVRLEDGDFIFEHDGEDFTEAQFASLCRFGYSNKHSLHTIGFRGIGFKSTFSIGEPVEVYTHSLAVSFDRHRFTAPNWLSGKRRSDRLTSVRVAVKDTSRRQEIQKNIEEWCENPLSLLFFKNIRYLTVAGQEILWHSVGQGPVPSSQLYALNDDTSNPFVMLRSAPQPFPPDAAAEIRQQRMLGDADSSELPPCTLELVMRPGVSGHIFVVLPTNVRPDLPFVCNAPFMQDPARMEISDPATSPTNRWLLKRAGELAASAMLSWLRSNNLSIAERARAYALFPNEIHGPSSIHNSCAQLVKDAFIAAIAEENYMLADDGTLVPPGHCIDLPSKIGEVWPPMEAASYFDAHKRSAISWHIEAPDRKKLLNAGALESVKKEVILDVLQRQSLPRPAAWSQLLTLWAYVAPEILKCHYEWEPLPKAIRILPVVGSPLLANANGVVRVGKQTTLSPDDWQFLSKHLAVLDNDWPALLDSLRKTAIERNDNKDTEMVGSAESVLVKMQLGSASQPSAIINHAACRFFACPDIIISEAVRMAHLAAKLNAKIGTGSAFRYFTRDGRLRSLSESIVVDLSGNVANLVPEPMRDALLLHDDYAIITRTCTSQEWRDWIAHGLSGLRTFLPLVNKTTCIYDPGRSNIEMDLRRRGLQEHPTYSYKTPIFRVTDWDFDETCWQHWQTLARENNDLWTHILKAIFAQITFYVSDDTSVKACQVSQQRSEARLTNKFLVPSWVLRLRELPCLKDHRGFQHKPCDLLRRTVETEPFLDVEPFIEHPLDIPENLKLLDLLGVRTKPIGPEAIIDRLRALAHADSPPIADVENWYRRLDQIAASGSASDLQTIKGAFADNNLIFTQSRFWTASVAVFLSAGDLPGIDLVRDSVRDLPLWQKIGVAAQPSADAAIRWLNKLPSGCKLPEDDLRRIRKLLEKYPPQIWDRCGSWLSLSNEWVSTASLRYALTMQPLAAWSHLHEWVKQGTADLRPLRAEIIRQEPFTSLPLLTQCIEERPAATLPATSAAAEHLPWLTCFGELMSRVILQDADDTAQINSFGKALSQAPCQTVDTIEVIPYIDATPAGTPREADCLWSGSLLFIKPLTQAKLAKLIPAELAKSISDHALCDALFYSFDRHPNQIRAYFEENFELAAIADAAPGPPLLSVSEPSVPAACAAHPAEAPDRVSPQTDVVHMATPSSAKSLNTAPQVGLTPNAPRQMPIVERFLIAQGFHQGDTGQYLHPSGSRVVRSGDGSFPWQHFDAAGRVVRYYWGTEHCLYEKPLAIDFEKWSLLEKYPPNYSLVLLSPSGDPEEMPGLRIMQLKQDGKITLHPAQYRLVLGINS